MSYKPTEEGPLQSPSTPTNPPGKAPYRYLELATNVAILIVAVLLSAALVKNYLMPKGPATQVSSAIKAGAQMTIPGVNWQESKKTVVLFLSKGCHSCTESAPFYRQLAERAKSADAPRVIAIFPGDADAGRRYLADLDVPLETIVQASPSVTGVRSAPTLLVADQSGRVIGSWRGKLPEEKQGDILNHFPPDGNANM